MTHDYQFENHSFLVRDYGHSILLRIVANPIVSKYVWNTDKLTDNDSLNVVVLVSSLGCSNSTKLNLM